VAELDEVLRRFEALLARAERLLPEVGSDTDWSAPAFRWRAVHGAVRRGYLQPVHRPHRLRLADLMHVERQKALLDQNTRQFLAGLPANNALLWGSRGTGKSSLVKALLNEHAEGGLRLIEVDKADLIDLPDIVERVQERPERFVVFTDDLSFEADDASYKALKAILDGSIAQPPENLLIYATSNRRHLMPEYMRENLEAQHVEGEVHQGEAVEEKISLSERFGLWLSFYPFKQDEYLRIVHHWVEALGGDAMQADALERDALQYALLRGSRSGRVARQFAADWVGRKRLSKD
jgi:predicted AAA+ superfamily ATPase